MPFLVCGIAALVLASLGSIPFGLDWLLVGPLLGISVYVGHRDLFGA